MVVQAHPYPAGRVGCPYAEATETMPCPIKGIGKSGRLSTTCYHETFSITTLVGQSLFSGLSTGLLYRRVTNTLQISE